jgi:hypothetical protein
MYALWHGGEEGGGQADEGLRKGNVAAALHLSKSERKRFLSQLQADLRAPPKSRRPCEAFRCFAGAALW